MIEPVQIELSGVVISSYRRHMFNMDVLQSFTIIVAFAIISVE